MMVTKRFKNLDMIRFVIEFYLAPDKWLFFDKWGKSSFFNTFVVLFYTSVVGCKNDCILILPVVTPFVLAYVGKLLSLGADSAPTHMLVVLGGNAFGK